MDELISRQKAKDAIDMALDHIDHVPPWVYDNLLNALNEVPSAEPSAKDINVPSNDAISRQRVIEAIDKFIPADPMKNDYTQGISVGLAIATRCIEEFSQETDESSQGLVKDLISRQDAIDAVETKIKKWNAVDGEGYHVGLGLRYTDVIDTLTELPSVQEKPFNLPEIYIAEGYDTIEDEDGNVGFGVYIPDEKQIYVVGDVDNEVRLKALFHELCHWVQDMCGRPFDEDEANRFAEVVYDALPSVHPEHLVKESGNLVNDLVKGDCISRQAAITIPILPKEHRKYQTMNLDDAYELGWFDCQECIEDLSSASPDLSGYSDRLWKLAYERGKASAQLRKGKWIETEFLKLRECSCCHVRWGMYDVENFDFCPNCGSYNGGDSDDNE